MRRLSIYPPRSRRDKDKKGTGEGGGAFVQRERKTLEVITASSVAEIIVGPPKPGTRWNIERAVVSTDSVAATLLRVGVPNLSEPRNIVDRTPQGNGDVADNVRAVSLAWGETAVFEWSGGDAGGYTAYLNLVVSIETET